MKKSLRVFVVIITVVVVGYFAIHLFINKKVDSALSSLVEKGEITYADYDLNLIAADFSIDSLTYFSGENIFFVTELKIQNIGLGEYVLNKNFKAGNLQLKEPSIKINKKSEKDSTEKENGSNEFKKTISVDAVEVENGNLIYKEDTLTKLEWKNYNLKLSKIKVDAQSLQKTVPFEYEQYDISGGKLSYILNDLQTLSTENIKIEEEEIVLSDLKLIPNYSRKEYVKVIPYEKDLMDMKMRELRITDYKFDLESKRSLLDISKINMDSVDFKIYRNKLVKDDTRQKKMYSAMLRDLPFDLNIDSLQLHKANVTYEEVQEKTAKTGKIFFTEMNLDVRDLTNFSQQENDFPETVVDIKCQMYGQAPLDVTWTFKVDDPQDNFRIKGQAKGIPPNSLNSFFEPAFNMNASGENIEAIYFDFYGDKNIAQGEYQMVYDDLKIEVLKKEKDWQKNKILSFFANLFVSNKNNSGDQVVDVSGVERDTTRSFWNYFWNCILEGLKETLI